MNLRLSLVLLVVVMLFGASVAAIVVPVSAQQATNVDAPLWHLGDHWTWQWGKDQETDTVVGATGGYAMRVEIGADTHTLHYNPDFSSPDVHFNQFQFPFAIGKT
jgi:hypothetical protein